MRLMEHIKKKPSNETEIDWFREEPQPSIFTNSSSSDYLKWYKNSKKSVVNIDKKKIKIASMPKHYEGLTSEFNTCIAEAL